MKTSKTAIKKAIDGLDAAQLETLSLILNPVHTGERVNVTYRITQDGKNPFMFEHKTSAPASAANVATLAKKTGYAIAGYLVKLCGEAMANRLVYDRYLTAFRPKAAFQVEIIIDNNVKFVHLATKGQDAIRLTRREGGEDVMLSHAEISDKFLLIASMAELSTAMAHSLEFDVNVTELLTA